MKLKHGVSLVGLQLQMREVLIAANKIWVKHGQELVVTCGPGGTHGAASLHPYGYAVDLRTRYFDTSEYIIIASELSIELGNKYDVIVHHSHIHVEYDAILR